MKEKGARQMDKVVDGMTKLRGKVKGLDGRTAGGGETTRRPEIIVLILFMVQAGPGCSC